MRCIAYVGYIVTSNVIFWATQLKYWLLSNEVTSYVHFCVDIDLRGFPCYKFRYSASERERREPSRQGVVLTFDVARFRIFDFSTFESVRPTARVIKWILPIDFRKFYRFLLSWGFPCCYCKKPKFRKHWRDVAFVLYIHRTRTGILLI